MKLSEKRHDFLWMRVEMLAWARPMIESNNMIIYEKELYRTPEKQLEYFKADKSSTLHSKHLIGLAVDIVLIKGGKFLVNAPLYRIMGQWWIDHGGRWGGEFKKPYDPYHFEYNEKRRKIYLEEIAE